MKLTLPGAAPVLSASGRREFVSPSLHGSGTVDRAASWLPGPFPYLAPLSVHGSGRRDFGIETGL